MPVLNAFFTSAESCHWTRPLLFLEQRQFLVIVLCPLQSFIRRQVLETVPEMLDSLAAYVNQA